MLQGWMTAIRPWTLTAACIPIFLGTALAWQEGHFSGWIFFLTLVSGLLVQTGTNLINTYGDYASGVDTPDSATCPAMTAGAINPQTVKKAGIAAFLFTCVLGLVLTYYCGWPVLAAGLLGVICGYCYTAGLKPYKYLGLGPVFVFFLMGPLMVWPSYYIQTGSFSWQPVWVSLPISFLVTAILHCNDIRDFAHDYQAGITTMALTVGFGTSVWLYYLLYIAAYVCLGCLVLAGLLPWGALLPVLLLAMLPKVFRQAALSSAASFDNKQVMKVKTASGFHFQFGLLLVLGILLSPYLQGRLHI